MEEEQRKLVEELREVLDRFEALEGDYKSFNRKYMRLLKLTEKLAAKITDETLEELEDEELKEVIKASRLKDTWMTFHSFKI